MTSTTPIDGLADWLRWIARENHGGTKFESELHAWASAVESLALERIAVPEGQAPEEWLSEAMKLAGHIEAAGCRRGRVGNAPSDHEPEIAALSNHLRKRIAAPQAVPAQAEITDAEIEALADKHLTVHMETDIGATEPHAWVEGEAAFARAILSARKDRADALLREAANELEAWAGGHTRADSIIAVIRTYLKGEA